jgi:hypothetical protein
MGAAAIGTTPRVLDIHFRTPPNKASFTLTAGKCNSGKEEEVDEMRLPSFHPHFLRTVGICSHNPGGIDDVQKGMQEGTAMGGDNSLNQGTSISICQLCLRGASSL